MKAHIVWTIVFELMLSVKQDIGKVLYTEPQEEGGKARRREGAQLHTNMSQSVGMEWWLEVPQSAHLLVNGSWEY